jgi:hypothetical protein
MMNARLNKALVALLAVAAGACGDAPVDVAQNDPDRLVTNPSFVVIEAGETRLVQAYLVNALGNPVAGDVDFEACNAAISVEQDPDQTDLEPGNNFLITGNTLGSSCVNVSGSGEEATVNVRVIPADLSLTLADTLLSGSGTTAGVLFLDAAGAAATGFDLDEVSFSSLDEDIVSVDPATGDVVAKAPGTVGIVVTLDDGLGAARADTVNVTVIPGDFAGTVTPASGTSGTLITVDFAGSDPEFDETSSITIQAGFTTYEVDAGMFLISSSGTQVVTNVPFGAPAGDATVILSGLGPDEVALAQTFTVTAQANDDAFGDNDWYFNDEAPVAITVPADILGAINGGAGEINDAFAFTVPVGGATYDIVLDWDAENGSGDLDVIVYNNTLGGFSACTNTLATGDHPETGTCTLTGGMEYIFNINDYEESPALTNYRLTITPQ